MGIVAVPEHQPVAPAGTHCLTLLQETAERRQTRAGADHDDWAVIVCWQPEMRVRAQEDLQPVALAVPPGDVDRCYALPLPPMRRVVQPGDQQMRFLAH